MSTAHIHPFYRIWFTIVDPTTLVFTILACILSPSTMLATSVPTSFASYDPLSHGPLLYQSAALYAFMAIIFGALLRVSSDLNVWKIVQFATLVVDCALLVTLWSMLKQQNRLELAEWRGEDWFNAGFTIWVALIRFAFLGGLGVGTQVEEKTKTG
ncbi:hypothetical protein DPSP01_013157 [Paraphaeosphaeria sporulosa]|uniref:DUF7704 domain-containing protein n=1 Tax=Paraphaeosphaeria sporulosa TaxID=1460663 RepID=A0A177C1C5_9PLEO|nr:uncharacterized protein CC84DRAFT_1126851 [Paraphaeosphaeria sporulosa]OAG01295.1 hypothetical protein CC84DRAFT_1126851 [Paraphaeosphaeria sporulosa]